MRLFTGETPRVDCDWFARTALANAGEPCESTAPKRILLVRPETGPPFEVNPVAPAALMVTEGFLTWSFAEVFPLTMVGPPAPETGLFCIVDLPFT